MHLSEETYERDKIKILHFVNMLISGKTYEGYFIFFKNKLNLLNISEETSEEVKK